MKRPYQQGDVRCIPITAIPTTAKKVSPTLRGYVLAEGETTGHAHTLEALDTCEMFSDGASLFLSLTVPQKIRHEEHKEIELPAGKYKIGIVREVDPFENEIKKVQD